MKLDFSTFAFGYKIKTSTATPNWGTSLGQGKDHKIKNKPSFDEILKGMLYTSVKLSNVSIKKRGGHIVSGDDAESPIVLASVFTNVFINNTKITDGKFVMLLTRDTSGVHQGRFVLKYGPSNTYEENDIKYSNEDFRQQVNAQFGLANDACWFVSDINVTNQDELRLNAYIVDKENTVEYETIADQRKAWDAICEKNNEINIKQGENIILYGIPGCGKSYKIKTDYCEQEQYMERVVFHPDYTYSDFVGQILPQSDIDQAGNKNISYPFIPGPFTRILCNAVCDSENNYFLIIEELNRGNAPAIFGELFQLLDRKDGVSEYGINNADIAKEVYGNPDQPVKLPRNLFIIATMNTADQNVFTLDTAFKRRWNMKNIVNSIKECQFAKTAICNTNVTWEVFLETINNLIIANNDGCIENEDKRLGAFFIKENELKDINLFSEKVLMYLWTDAFKYNRDRIFKPEYKTLEQLILGFKENTFEIFIENIF